MSDGNSNLNLYLLRTEAQRILDCKLYANSLWLAFLQVSSKLTRVKEWVHVKVSFVYFECFINVLIKVT